MATYRVTTYEDQATYTVSLDDSGVAEVDGLPDNVAELLKSAVNRYMERNGLPAVTALGLAVGPYSTVTEVDDLGSVSDQEPATEVS